MTWCANPSAVDCKYCTRWRPKHTVSPTKFCILCNLLLSYCSYIIMMDIVPHYDFEWNRHFKSSNTSPIFSYTQYNKCGWLTVAIFQLFLNFFSCRRIFQSLPWFIHCGFRRNFGRKWLFDCVLGIWRFCQRSQQLQVRSIIVQTKLIEKIKMD